MKNFEKYEDEVRKFKDGNFCKDFVIPHILKKDDCAGICCSECISRQLLWYLEDYEEPEVDWNKVKVDTPILVRDVKYRRWVKRYFAKYKDGIVFAWTGGSTSEDAHNVRTPWKYAKLAESEETK